MCGSEAGPRGRPRPPALAGPDGALVCAASPGVEHVQSLSVLPALSGSHVLVPDVTTKLPSGSCQWEAGRGAGSQKGH